MALDKNFDTIDEATLAALQANGVTEGPTLEFKRDAYGAGDDEKKEFLKDLSALANTIGGHLVIGLNEVDGAAGPIAPLSLDVDAELLRLENLARDGIQPRIVGLRMRAVPVRGGHVLVLRVPRSMNAPHRVSFRASNRFYARNSAGAYELGVDELRASFTASASALDRARAFQQERTLRLDAGEGVETINRDTGILVLHLLPLASFTGLLAVDVDQRANAGGFPPVGSGGAMAPRLNFDGFIALTNGLPDSGYTQLFRNGVIEATSTYVANEFQERRWILATNLENEVAKVLPLYVGSLKRLEVPPPVAVTISLLGVQGLLVDIGRNPIGYRMGLPPAINRHQLDLPMVMVEDLDELPSMRKLLRPMFDALYNAAGVSRNEMFGADGEWIGGSPQ